MKKQPFIQQILQGMQQSVCPSDYWLTPGTEFPELKAAKLVIHRNGQSVWEHTMLVIDLLSIKNPITLLSGFFHDLGKNYTQSVNNPSLSKFPEHVIRSADIAKIKLIEWQASPYLIDRVSCLILTHMYDIVTATNEKTIRKFIASVRQDNVENWFALRIADSRSYNTYQRYHNHLVESFRIRVMSYLNQQPSMDQPEFSNPSKLGIVQIEGGDAS